ncbi:MAG: hypothetical protein IT379_41530 [Deltaproteobacteria bacterium]|nr:hypothetical protein [Deltaproteobacteria bacterium]
MILSSPPPARLSLEGSEADDLDALLRAIAERAVALAPKRPSSPPSSLALAETGEARPRRKPGRALLLGEGAVALSRALRSAEGVRLVDASVGAAQLVAFGGLLRTDVLIRLVRAGVIALADGLAIDVGDGVLLSVVASRLGEDPWERFDALRAVAPETLLRFTIDLDAPLGELAGDLDDAVAVARELAAVGVDAFRVSQSTNDPDRLAEAVSRIAGERIFVEAAIRYRGDLGRAADAPALERYAALATRLAAAGAHAIAVDDPVGRLTPLGAYSIVRWLGRATELPVVLRTHDSCGLAVATTFAAIEAGVEVVDVAAAPVAGGWSLPAMLPLVVALEASERATGEQRAAIARLDAAWAEIVGARLRVSSRGAHDQQPGSPYPGAPLPADCLDVEVPAAELVRPAVLWEPAPGDARATLDEPDATLGARRQVYLDAYRRCAEAGGPRSAWRTTRVARAITLHGSEAGDAEARREQPIEPPSDAGDADPRERLVRRLAPFAEERRARGRELAERRRDLPLLAVGDGAVLRLDGVEIAVRLETIRDLGGGEREVGFVVDGAPRAVRIGF